jgi:hypothetical protein
VERDAPRRFPPPWTVEGQAACFVVRDHNGQQLAYVYFEDEPRRRSAAKLLSEDKARRLWLISPSCQSHCVGKDIDLDQLLTWGSL